MTGDRRVEAMWTYIVGFGRSGSTLLGRLLAGGSGFHCGELHLLWEALVSETRCECGSRVARCDVWSEVATEVRSALGFRSNEEGALIMRRRLRRRHLLAPRLPLPRAAELELRRATEMAMARVTGAETLIDSSKLSSVLWTASHIDRPLFVVHLVRDPRAVAFSQSRAKFDPGRPDRAMARRPVVLSSADWMRGHVTTERVIRRVVDERRVERVQRIRYEDLVADPEGCLALVGVDPTRPASTVRTANAGHAVAGNPARFERSAVVPDERWRTEMRTSARMVSTLMTLPMLGRYGYAVRSAAPLRRAVAPPPAL